MPNKSFILFQRHKFECGSDSIGSWSEPEIDAELDAECALHGDCIRVDVVDVYRNLAHKVKAMYEWFLTNIPNTKWIVKADDDAFVKFAPLQTYLRGLTDPKNGAIVGCIQKAGMRVPKYGKWADKLYRFHPKHLRYPIWPRGSCGHAVNRPVAEYVANHDLKFYQVSRSLSLSLSLSLSFWCCRSLSHTHSLVLSSSRPLSLSLSLSFRQGEDVSLGIWMHESPLNVQWINSADEHFTWVYSKDVAKSCENPQLWMIGHQLTELQIRACMRSLR